MVETPDAAVGQYSPLCVAGREQAQEAEYGRLGLGCLSCSGGWRDTWRGVERRLPGADGDEQRRRGVRIGICLGEFWKLPQKVVIAGPESVTQRHPSAED